MALRSIARAAHMDPAAAFPRLKLAYALYSRGRLEEAVGQLRAARAAGPHDPLAAELAAAIHAELGQPNKAALALAHLEASMGT